MQHSLKLPDRLMAVASFIENGSSVVDIGTDHGYLPVYLALNEIARKIIASDISAGSLESARRFAAKYGVSGKITFVTAPGLSGVSETEADTVVIAGLGGETIADILKDAPWTKHRDVRLILQPQSKIVDLCCFLRESGYILLDAELSRDRNRFYVVILAAVGKSDSVLEPEFELYARLMFKRDSLFLSYMDDRIVKTRRALDGMKKASAPDAINTALKLAMYIGLKEEFEKNANCK